MFIQFKRKKLILLKLDGYLYAVGGQDGVSCLNFVEKYDANINKWTRVANMSTKRLGVAVCCLNNYLYAIGKNLCKIFVI